VREQAPDEECSLPGLDVKPRKHSGVDEAPLEEIAIG